jgi:hypothetical protein
MKSLMSSFFQKSYFITGEGCCSSFEFLKGDQLIAGQQRFAEMVDIELKTDVGFRSLVTFLAANEVMQARIKSHIFLNCKDKTKYEFTYEDMCDFCGKIPEKHYLFVINCPNTCCAPNIIWPELNLGHDGDYPFKTYLFSFIDTIQFTLQLIELQGESTCEDSLFHELNHACHYALGMRILSSDFFRSSPKHPFIADFMFNNTGLIKAYLSDIIDCILNGGLADDQLEIFEQNVREVLRGAMSEYVLSLRTDADGTEIYDPIDVKSECFIGNLSKHVKDDGFATELKDFLFLYIMGKLFDYVEEVFNIYGFLFVDDILYINMLSDFDRNFELNCSLLRYPYMGVRKSSIEAGVGKAVPTLAFSANAAPSVEDISEWIEFYCEYHIINHCIPTKDALPTLKILHGKS